MGKRGAGSLVLAADTGRALFALRSLHVHEPGTWAFWGGAINPGESAKNAAIRELREETDYRGPILRLKKLFDYQEGAFHYTNFILVVPHEFEPDLNWENDEAKWVPLEKIPTPWHYGVKAVLDDPEARAILAAESGRLRPRRPRTVLVELSFEDAMLLRAGALVTARDIFQRAGNTRMVDVVQRAIDALERAEPRP